jgi:dihydrofolate synthase/folylpolyglutamate synthase
MDEVGRFGRAGEVCDTVPAAIERARGLAGEQDLIVITGSLYVVGEAQSYCDPERFPVEPM